MDPLSDQQSLVQNILFLKALLARLDEFKDRLGDEWPKFRDRLLVLLRQIYDSRAQEGRAERGILEETLAPMDDLILLALGTPAEPLIKSVLKEITTRTEQRGSTRGEVTPRPEEASFEIPAVQEYTSGDFYDAVASLGKRLENAEAAMLEANGGGQPSPPPSPLEAPSPRYLNAGFFEAGSAEPLPADRPLALDSGPFLLGVNVGRRWGPGEAGEPVNGVLADIFQDRESLELEVTVRSRTVVVDPPLHQLTVPREGDSSQVYFKVSFRTRVAWRHRLNIDLFYKGHLLQSRHLEVEAVRRSTDPVPSDRAPQDGRLIFSRASRLTPQTLAILEERPRRLTITVQRDEGRLDLCFYDRTRGSLGQVESRLTDAELASLLKRMRRALEAVTNSYKDSIGGSLEQLRLGLWQLADVGSDFYRALLPALYNPEDAGPEDEVAELDLVPGQVIQVAPLSRHAGVPWELLYERRIERYDKKRLNRVSLCPEFKDHLDGACPNANNHRIVCPSGFWGYRYIIEQLPNGVPRGETLPAFDLPLHVRNGLPLQFAALTYEFKNVQEHLQRLRDLAGPEGVKVSQVSTLEDLEKTLESGERLPDILYFYAHGGLDQDELVLELGPRNESFSFASQDLETWPEIDLSLRYPLVVLNACESASYRPGIIENLLESFMKKGAAGIVGTQVTIPTTLADGFINVFFRAFLGKRTVGEALFDARLAMLRNEAPGAGPLPDPRGLAYSLFATADIRLAQPVIVMREA